MWPADDGDNLRSPGCPRYKEVSINSEGDGRFRNHPDPGIGCGNKNIALYDSWRRSHDFFPKSIIRKLKMPQSVITSQPGDNKIGLIGNRQAIGAACNSDFFSQITFFQTAFPGTAT